MSQLTIDRAAFSVHRHVTSEHSEPHALFAEVKTCMENARANIRNFLQGEKEKPSQPPNAASDGLADYRAVSSLAGAEMKSSRSSWGADSENMNANVLSKNNRASEFNYIPSRNANVSCTSASRGPRRRVDGSC
jgi:hypothetical protein